MKRLIDQLHHETAELSELERIFQFSSPQFLKLIDTLVKVKGVDLYKGKGCYIVDLYKGMGCYIVDLYKGKGCYIVDLYKGKGCYIVDLYKCKVCNIVDLYKEKGCCVVEVNLYIKIEGSLI